MSGHPCLGSRPRAEGALLDPCVIGMPERFLRNNRRPYRNRSQLFFSHKNVILACDDAAHVNL
jgi:hypothetical protein